MIVTNSLVSIPKCQEIQICDKIVLSGQPRIHLKTVNKYGTFPITRTETGMLTLETKIDPRQHENAQEYINEDTNSWCSRYLLFVI